MAEQQRLPKATKLAMISQFLGFMLDAYDMAMVIVMAPILVKIFVSPKGQRGLAVPDDRLHLLHHHGSPPGRIRHLRPLCRQDRTSIPPDPHHRRRRRDVVCLPGFLPTYQQIGVWSYVLFCVLRFLMGCFFGGEYAVGHVFAIEHAPQPRRGAIGGFIQSGFPLGYVFASLVVASDFFATG